MPKSHFEIAGQASFEEQFSAPADDQRNTSSESYPEHRSDKQIVIDDAERGGLSERDRLAIPVDEQNHIIREPGIQNPNSYAAKLIEEMGPKALVEKYQQLNRSNDPNDQKLAQALAASERVQGLLKERR